MNIEELRKEIGNTVEIKNKIYEVKEVSTQARIKELED